MEKRKLGTHYLYTFAFPTSEDAHSVASECESIITRYRYVTLDDICELCGIETTYEDNLVEWTDETFSAWITYKNEGEDVWLLNIPAPEEKHAADSPSMIKTDNVNHPTHYQSKTGLETIDVIQAFTEGLDGIEAVCTANVLKYICRWKKKNGLEDLKKAQWYLNKLIKEMDK